MKVSKQCKQCMLQFTCTKTSSKCTCNMPRIVAFEYPRQSSIPVLHPQISGQEFNLSYASVLRLRVSSLLYRAPDSYLTLGHVVKFVQLICIPIGGNCRLRRHGVHWSIRRHGSRSVRLELLVVDVPWVSRTGGSLRGASGRQGCDASNAPDDGLWGDRGQEEPDGREIDGDKTDAYFHDEIECDSRSIVCRGEGC